MDDEEYDNIVNYLSAKTCPSSFTKNQKKTLRRKCKNFCWDEKQCNLWYVKHGKRRLVIKGKQQKLRVLEECHLSEFGGHVGRDNTARKINDRYYWPDYYKDIVSMVNQRTQLFVFIYSFID